MSDNRKANEDYKRQTEAVAAVTGTRYCSHHNGFAPVAGGTWKGTGSGKRWRCASCSVPKKPQEKAT